MFWIHKYLKCIFKLKENVLHAYVNFIRFFFNSYCFHQSPCSDFKVIKWEKYLLMQKPSF